MIRLAGKLGRVAVDALGVLTNCDLSRKLGRRAEGQNRRQAMFPRESDSVRHTAIGWAGPVLLDSQRDFSYNRTHR